jgi:CMP-N-acetylneuraminic acid synthetase
VWIAQADRLLQEGSFYGGGHLFWEMAWTRAVDIDTHDDLAMARVLHAMARETA